MHNIKIKIRCNVDMKETTKKIRISCLRNETTFSIRYDQDHSKKVYFSGFKKRMHYYNYL